ncbi:MAG: sigma-70 family RNA polymerase sigma factor, partial [Acidobacteria bacterium]|nr:sigma-70 family RNA polymerase sigma factor [Acidobacteriota bacterium]
AEEVTFDVYTQVWRSAKSFDAQRGTITAWLVTLTRSCAIDRLRSVAVRSQHEEHLPEFPQMAASPENPEQSQQRRLVRAALEVLPPEQRQAIEMAFFSGLSHSEVATKLGLPLGTAKTRIRLGMMKLRELLGAGA